MEEDYTEAKSKWQPVMVVVRDGSRLECICGALAVMVLATVNGDKLVDVDYWCQACYLRSQQEEIEKQL